MELSLSNGIQLELSQGLPGDYRGPVLSRTNALCCKNQLADLVIQQIKGEEYSIRFIIGKLLLKLDAKGWLHADGLYGYWMLKNGSRKNIQSIGNLHIRENQYIWFYSDASECSTIPENTQEFRALDIFYSPKFLQEMLQNFPELQVLLDQSNGSLLKGKPSWILPHMKEITEQILHCPYNETLRQLYFDVKVRELLIAMLENSFHKKSNTFQFSPYEIDQIQAAKEYLANHIKTKPPSIRALAKIVGLNELKLKRGFKQYFQSTIFDWLVEQKMQEAKNLLLHTNRPIKEIAASVGYPRTTNFITAFRRRFGYTPGSLRRN